MTKLYLQLSHSIQEKITLGLLKSGERLASIRSLMDSHGVAKNTVISALNDLEMKGFIVAKPKVGYFVTQTKQNMQRVPEQHFPDTTLSKVSLSDVFYDVMTKQAAFDIIPNEQSTPPTSHLASLNKCLRRAFREEIPFRTSHYDTPKGLRLLREQISLRYRQRNIPIDASELCITSGCQHGLMLALMACCEPGDVVAVESPTFYGSLLLLEQLKLKVVEISSHPLTGLDVTHLSSVLKNQNIKACIATPNFATPTGSLMPEESRKSLVMLANKYDFALIEDDIYGEISFSNTVSSLKSYDVQNRVIISSSVSKVLSKDIRIGWVAGGKWQKKIEHLKLTSMLAASRSVQAGLAQFMHQGGYRKHINYTNLQLNNQLQTLVDVIQQHWPTNIKYTVPNGGIALWVELPKPIDSMALYHALLNKHIVVTPGILFSHRNSYSNYLRLSFQHKMTPKRVAALKVIGKMLAT
ncbi:GntR family transcriptional regulator [Thalassotalea loyana]|uniref:GntR family transcriptional regulator n=1 Tax=Thalassotalea loyana TaxID=280483 RepID=A0ABQ6HC52_9GAMM|nr:PLP-dependent aminotransferase family protein [Thalassotalea loyana]GLX85119.1 GntR family transcriptional regulator [Thalassotalea loyana]